MQANLCASHTARSMGASFCSLERRSGLNTKRGTQESKRASAEQRSHTIMRCPGIRWVLAASRAKKKKIMNTEEQSKVRFIASRCTLENDGASKSSTGNHDCAGPKRLRRYAHDTDCTVGTSARCCTRCCGSNARGTADSGGEHRSRAGCDGWARKMKVSISLTLLAGTWQGDLLEAAPAPPLVTSEKTDWAPVATAVATLWAPEAISIRADRMVGVSKWPTNPSKNTAVGIHRCQRIRRPRRWS
mgnify:CR=1 FL=1